MTDMNVPDNLPPALRRQLEAAGMIGDDDDQGFIQDLQAPGDDARENLIANQDSADWKHRYEVLNGKYQAEVPRMAEEIRYLRSEIQALRDMASAAPTPATRSAETPAEDDSLTEVLGELKETFGDDDATVKLAQALIKKVSTVDQRVGQVGNDLAATQREEAKRKVEAYWAELRKIPDFETKNNDSGFDAWLAEIDPPSGLPRQALLTHANNNLDAPRVRWFFESYFGSNRSRTKPSNGLHRHVQPNTRAPDAGGQDKPTYTKQQIVDFSKNLAIKQARMTPEQRQQAEAVMADMEQAWDEGRVVG